MFGGGCGCRGGGRRNAELWAIEAKSTLVMVGVPLGGAKLYDHATGEVLAYGLTGHSDDALLALKALWEPLGIMQFYSVHGSVPQA